jgi:hypothetical protein
MLENNIINLLLQRQTTEITVDIVTYNACLHLLKYSMHREMFHLKAIELIRSVSYVLYHLFVNLCFMCSRDYN